MITSTVWVASPGPLLPLPISLFLSIGTACSILWLVAEMARRYSVRGSAPRYVWASVERPLRWPALLWMVISVVIEVQWYSDWVLATTGCLGIACWITLWNEKRNGDDDDDFWKGLGKRLKNALGTPHAAMSTGSA